MLQTVAIRGYRSLREVILPLGRLSIITGANGAGKSSVYRALRLLADCGRGEVIEQYVNVHVIVSWFSSGLALSPICGSA